MTDVKIHDNALALQTKGDMLAWIGILPEDHAIRFGLQARVYRKILAIEDTPESMRSDTINSIADMHSMMNEGINIILKKLSGSECIECGKCDDLRGIMQDLLDDKDIHTINAKIKEQYGDITTTHGIGMPGEGGKGHPSPFQVVEMKGGNILELIKMIAGRRSDFSMDSIGSMAPSNNPIKTLLDSIFKNREETPDKDKLH